MLGKHPNSNPAKVCIIGAGCSGFTTAKALLDRRMPFDCFEMSDEIGGNWTFRNKSGKAACYRSLHIDTSKRRMQFADFPAPDSFPDYPHHSEVNAYFNAYVDHFGLRERITFNTEVLRCDLTPERRWQVRLSTGESKTYDTLLVCTVTIGTHMFPPSQAYSMVGRSTVTITSILSSHSICAA
jgi:cation diffusion facilitator CzcD-associated flavoprotein CzcO